MQRHPFRQQRTCTGSSGWSNEGSYKNRQLKDYQYLHRQREKRSGSEQKGPFVSYQAPHPYGQKSLQRLYQERLQTRRRGNASTHIRHAQATTVLTTEANGEFGVLLTILCFGINCRQQLRFHVLNSLLSGQTSRR